MTQELEGLLSEAMRRHNESVDAPSGALDRAVARNRRRRRVTRTLTGTAAMAAAIAVGLTATAGRPAQHRDAVPQPPAAAPAVQTVGYLTARAAAAIDASDAVLYSRMQYGSSGDLAEEWTDTHTGWTLARDSGRLSCASLMPPGQAAGTETTVDYRQHTWWTNKITPARDQLQVGFPDDLRPSAIRAALAGKQISLDGHESVAGRDTVRLTGPMHKGNALWIMAVWVDAKTYLPVRLGFGPSLAQLANTIDLSWLPRTAANQARVALSPPAGFREAKYVPGTGTGSDC
jgi:hypothetical protein